MTPRTKWALCDEHLGAAFRVPSEALFVNAVLMEPADDTALQNSQLRERRLQYIPFRVPAQPVDATQVLNLSAGVSNPKVFRGRSFS